MTRRTIISAAVVVLIATLFTGEAFAVHSRYTRQVRPHLRRARMRRIPWNPLLKGSHESLIRQNEEIDRLNLARIQDDVELDERIANNELVPISEQPGLHIAGNLKPNRRYAKPWTRDFATDLGQAYYDEFGVPIQLTSAVRTAQQQKKLRRHNRNAAPIEGDTASSHLAGLTVDIGKRGLTKKQHKWVENYFAKLRELSLIEVAEERRQACFHVMVSERYIEWRNSEGAAEPTDVANVTPAPAASDEGGSQQ